MRKSTFILHFFIVEFVGNAPAQGVVERKTPRNFYFCESVVKNFAFVFVFFRCTMAVVDFAVGGLFVCYCIFILFFFLTFLLKSIVVKSVLE